MKKLAKRGIDALLGVDLPGTEAFLKVFCGQVDVHDLVGLRDDLVGHAFLHSHARCLLNEIVEGFEVLDIDGRDDVDTGAQEILDVLVSLAVRAVGRIGMGQLVDESYGGLSSDDGVDVHFA